MFLQLIKKQWLEQLDNQVQIKGDNAGQGG